MQRRNLPNNLDAEQSVVGGILVAPTAFHQVADAVSPEDFYHPTLGAIYAAMVALAGAGQPIDQLTVEAQMRAVGSHAMLNAAGGGVYFGQLMSGVVTVENLAYHARIVRGKATMRALIVAGHEIAGRGLEDSADTDEVIEEAERAIFQIAQRGERSPVVTMKKLMNGVVRTLEKRYSQRAAVTGVPTGFEVLDSMTAGLQPGDLVVVAARPSMGKTSLVLNIALSASIRHRVPVLVFSLEMSKESLAERILCAEGRIDSQVLRTGHLIDKDWITVTKATSRIAEAPIWVDDSAAPTLIELRARARRWRADTGIFAVGAEQLGLVVVDYLQLIQGPRRSRETSREREISEISRGLKALAKELRCPVVALSQLNRLVESRADKRPQLSDLRESGAIEQDADVIAFIYRDEVYNKETEDQGVAEIIIGKQRNGPTGTVRLAFLKQYTRFENLAEARA